MFGYVTIHKEELKIKEYETYKGFYCGACQALRREYGLSGQMTLSYDLTFLTLLLSSLYEPEQQFSKKRCIAHPQKKRLMIENEFSEYAAHMSLLLTWYKLLDDWRDEKKASALAGLRLYRRAFLKARKLYPEKEAVIRKYLKELSGLEKKNSTDIDLVAGTFGHLLGSVFAVKEDMWQELLYRTGFYLGKFIYLMDAWDDLKKDEKSGNYNILLLRKKQRYGQTKEEEDRFAKDCETLLVSMMAACCEAFEKLPLVQDVAILENILYDGVWNRFDKLKKEAENISARSNKNGEKDR